MTIKQLVEKTNHLQNNRLTYINKIKFLYEVHNYKSDFKINKDVTILILVKHFRRLFVGSSLKQKMIQYNSDYLTNQINFV